MTRLRQGSGGASPAPGRSPGRGEVRCGLFATDLDGTVLVDRGRAGVFTPPRTLATLKRLQDSGVTVCLASGRMHESIAIIAGSMGLKGPIISCNGAMVRLADGETLLHHTLDGEVADHMVEFSETEGLPMNFYHNEMIYSRRFQPWWDLYEGRTASPMQEVESLRRFAGTAPTKLLLMAEPPRILELEAHFRPRFEGRANVLITGDEYLEIMPLSASKGSALEALASHLGVARGDVVAAGDGHNDVEMLRWAGTALAVKTGRETVKSEADHIVDGPEQEGVARFIEERIL